MFEIDLLKGKGCASKGNLPKMVTKAVPFLIPVIALTVWAASYQQNSVRIKSLQAATQKNRTVIDRSQQAVRAYRQMNMRLTKIDKRLEAITKGLNYRIQVTDLLVELVQALPAEIFLCEIELGRDVSMETLPKTPGDTKKQKKELVVQRKLDLVVCGYDPVQSDRWVREYVERLKTSELLDGIFTDVKPAARRQGTVDQRPATFYEIECIFREQR